MQMCILARTSYSILLLGEDLELWPKYTLLATCVKLIQHELQEKLFIYFKYLLIKYLFDSERPNVPHM